MKKPYPLRSKKVARVFLCIVNKKEKVSEISKALKVERTAVYNQIEALQKEGLIKRKGKRKGFEVDFEGYISLLFKNWFSGTYNFRSKKKTIALTLPKQSFNFIENYLTLLSKEYNNEEMYYNNSIEDIIDDFHLAVPKLIFLNNHRKIKDKNQRIAFKGLYNLMKVFYLKEVEYSAPLIIEKAFDSLKNKGVQESDPQC